MQDDLELLQIDIIHSKLLAFFVLIIVVYLVCNRALRYPVFDNVDLENPEGAESIQFSSKTPRLPARFRVKSDRYGWFLTARSTVPFLAVLILIPLLDFC